MRLRHCCSAIVVLGEILLSAAAAHAKPPVPDWKALQFTCTKEQNPEFDDVSESWFQCAKGLESQQDEARDAEMEQASERGHYKKAMLNLAGLYVRGVGVDRNERKALDLVERAMNLVLISREDTQSQCRCLNAHFRKIMQRLVTCQDVTILALKIILSGRYFICFVPQKFDARSYMGKDGGELSLIDAELRDVDVKNFAYKESGGIFKNSLRIRFANEERQ